MCSVLMLLSVEGPELRQGPQWGGKLVAGSFSDYFLLELLTWISRPSLALEPTRVEL